MATDGAKWFQMAPNAPRWREMVTGGGTWSQVAPGEFTSWLLGRENVSLKYRFAGVLAPGDHSPLPQSDGMQQGRPRSRSGARNSRFPPPGDDRLCSSDGGRSAAAPGPPLAQGQAPGPSSGTSWGPLGASDPLRPPRAPTRRLGVRNRDYFAKLAVALRGFLRRFPRSTKTILTRGELRQENLLRSG